MRAAGGVKSCGVVVLTKRKGAHSFLCLQLDEFYYNLRDEKNCASFANVGRRAATAAARTFQCARARNRCSLGGQKDTIPQQRGAGAPLCGAHSSRRAGALGLVEIVRTRARAHKQSYQIRNEENTKSVCVCVCGEKGRRADDHTASKLCSPHPFPKRLWRREIVFLFATQRQREREQTTRSSRRS